MLRVIISPAENHFHTTPKFILVRDFLGNDNSLSWLKYLKFKIFKFVLPDKLIQTKTTLAFTNVRD